MKEKKKYSMNSIFQEAHGAGVFLEPPPVSYERGTPVTPNTPSGGKRCRRGWGGGAGEGLRFTSRTRIVHRALQ